MNFQIRLFAALAEKLGTSSLRVEFGSDCVTSEVLKEEIGRLHPSLTPLLGHAMVAVNHQFARDGQPILASDEIALIPPVSGG